MTQELSLLKSLEQRIKRIEAAVIKDKANGDWIKQEDVTKEYGYSERTLRQFRKDGKLTKVRSISGRKFQYSRKELEKLYTL